jgi:outer membrane protein, multidrug efflux system
VEKSIRRLKLWKRKEGIIDMKKVLFLFLSALMVSGCMVGPKYHRPKMDPAPTYVNKNEYISDADSVLNLKWFKLFGDDVLIGLIDTALKNNLNLKIAIARIEEGRAQYGFSKADLFPKIGYIAAASSSNVTGEPGINSASNFIAVGNVSWELDVWGKIRHSKRAAFNQMLASVEGKKTIQSTLVSDVASLYFQLRDFDNRLEIANNTVISRQDYYDKMKARFNGGDISEMELLQSEQQLRNAQAAVPNFERQVAFIEHSLNVLLGQRTTSIPRGLKNFDQPQAPIIPAGLPSTLLEQRPDIKTAEYNYVADVERIGVAEALRFPSLSLTGYLGGISDDLSSITSPEAATSNISARLLGPIFNFGKNIRRVDVQRKVAEQSMYRYINTYLGALADVENSLVAIRTFRTEYEARQLQSEAARKNLELSRARYDNGFTSYLEVLTAENGLFDASLAASSVRAQQLSSSVTLYRSLGGGWSN